MNHEIQERPMPTYIGNNGEPGIFGWLECPETLDPLDSLASYESQTAIRQKWCAIAHDSIQESVICYPGGFSSVLLNQFEPLYQHVVANLGALEIGAETFTYDEFLSALTKAMVNIFTLSQKVVDSILEQAKSLETIKNMGMPLTQEEQNLLAVVQGVVN
jgi:hypothetical protein